MGSQVGVGTDMLELLCRQCSGRYQVRKQKTSTCSPQFAASLAVWLSVCCGLASALGKGCRSDLHPPQALLLLLLPPLPPPRGVFSAAPRSAGQAPLSRRHKRSRSRSSRRTPCRSTLCAVTVTAHSGTAAEPAGQNALLQAVSCTMHPVDPGRSSHAIIHYEPCSRRPSAEC